MPIPPRLPPLLLGLLAAPALAQAPPPQPGLIERVAPAESPRLGPALLPPEPPRATGPGEARRIAIAEVRVEGATALDPAALRGPLAGLAGREVALAEIETARLALLRAYRAAGFPYVAVAARLEAAEGGAALRFAVTEGVIADILLEGDIGPAARQARRFLDPLLGQRPIPAAALERALLLAGDIPGVTTSSVLRPVAGEPGALQLVVRLARDPLSGFASLDNRGYRLTGAGQGLLVGQLNAFTALGERTELAILGTEGGRQSFVQATEEAFLGGSGLRLRLWAGAGRAEPGSPLAAIGYAGETRVAGLALAYPLLRSRPANLTLTAGLDAFESVVETGLAGTGQRQSRDAVRALRLGVEAAAQDAWLGLAPAAASTSLSLRLHRGIQAFGASDGDAGTGARAGADFGFARLVAETTRLQPLFSPAEGWLVSAQGTLAGQWSDSVLPPAEKFYLGGNRLGRGFYAGQVAGDRALAGSAELQAGRVFEIPRQAGPLRLGLQLYLFRDEARGWDNGAGGTERALASWGGGVRLQFDERLQLDLEGVRRLTRRPEGAGVAPLDESALFARVLLRF